MKQIPLDLLVQKLSGDLVNLLNEAGTCEPQTQMLGQDLVIPRNYQIDEDDIRYAESTVPIYSAYVAKTLHPANGDSSEEGNLITT